MPKYNSRMWGTVFTYRCLATNELVTRYTRKSDPYRRTLREQRLALRPCIHYKIHYTQMLPIAGCRVRNPRRVCRVIKYNLQRPTRHDIHAAYAKAGSSPTFYLDGHDPRRVPVDYYMNRYAGFPKYKSTTMKKYYAHIDRLTARGEDVPQELEYYTE